MCALAGPAAILAAGLAGSADGSATVFLSPITTVDGGATVSSPAFQVELGQSFQLGVWVAAPQGLTITGLSLDLVEDADRLTATSHQIQEGDDAGGSVQRWLPDTIDLGTLNDSPTDLLTFTDAASLPGLSDASGLSGDALERSLDDSFDPAVGDHGAFLHSVLTLDATALGTANLFLKVGQQRIGTSDVQDTDVFFGTGDDAVDRTVVGAMSGLPDAVIEVVESLAVPGDADGDGDVDAFDLGIWQTQFGMTGPELSADFDDDGDVDAFDLGLWQTNFGTGVGAAIPEPGTCAMLALAGLGLLRRR